MPSFDDIDLELDAIRSFHARRESADAAVAQISESQARAATVVHDYYRWLPPSVSLALSSAGLGPDSDVTRRIAAQLLGSGVGLAQRGEEVSPDELAGAGSSTDSMGLLAKAAYERYGVLYDTNAREGVGSTPGTGGGGFMQGLKHAALEDWSDPMSKVRGATRAADAWGRFLPQYATGQYRNFRKQVQDKGLLQTVKDDLTSPRQIAFNAYTAGLQTDYGAATDALAAGDRVDTGSGFFLNDNHGGTNILDFGSSEGTALEQYMSPEERAAAEAKRAEQQARMVPTGLGTSRNANQQKFGPVETWGDGSKHSITIGRDIAGHLLGLEPGSRGYNLTSGFADAAIQIASQKPGQAASQELRAARAFKGVAALPEDASALERMRDSVGALWSPGRRMTYDANLAHTWVNGVDGQKVAEAFSGINSTHTLDQLTGGKLSPSTLAKLADAEDAPAVTKVLHDAVSAHEISHTINAASWKRMGIDVRNGLPRFANRAMDIVPDSVIDLRDGRKTLTEADRWASAMKLSEEQRSVLHDTLSRIPDEPQFLGDGLDHYRAVEHANLTQKARATAIQDAMRDASANYMDRYSRFKTIVDEGETVHGAEKVYAAQQKLAAARERIDKALKFGFDRADEEVRYYQDELNQNHSFFGATIRGRADASALLDQADAAERAMPWQMTRTEWEATSQRLYHGTSREFASFTDDPEVFRGNIGTPGGGWRDPSYYFTEDPSVANRFALEQRNSGVSWLDPIGMRSSGISEKDVIDDFRRAFDTGMPVGEMVDGVWVPVSREQFDDLVVDGLLDPERQFGIMRGTASPRVVVADVRGRTIDLTGDVETFPESLVKALRADGIDTGRMAWSQHQASPGLTKWMRENGYAKAIVRDDPFNTGGKSILALPAAANMTDHRQLVIDALDAGSVPPRAVLADYPDLAEAYGLTGEMQMPRRATPMLSSETVHGMLPMPDPQEVRRAFNSPLMQAWAKIPGVDLGTVALENLMDKWRTINLLKPALGVRIIGDGQARLLAEGGDSIVAHPARAIAWMLGDSKFSDEWFAHGKSNMLGELFNREDEWASSLNKTTRGFWQDIRYKRIEGHKGFLYGQDGFEDAWHYQLSKLHASAPGQIAANADNLDTAIGKWWDLADVREQYAKAHPASRSMPGAISGDDLLNPQGAAAYMEDVSKRLRHMTQDDPRLVAAVKTGNLHVTDPDIVQRARDAGYAIHDIDGVETAVLPMLEGIVPNPLVTDALKTDEFAQAARGFGNREIVGRVAKVSELERSKGQQFIDGMFATLLGRPENFISKSPVARQEYWNFVREKIAYLDPKEADTIVANAEKAGLARDQLRTIKRMAGKAGVGDDLLSAEEMHALAEAHAAQRVRDILDDMSHRHQAFDMVKLIMPFGEAWHQVITKWSKILAQPHVWSEMSVAARALRSPELGSVVEPENQSYDPATGQMTTRGLFYPDENGNETIAFPLSRQMLGLFGDAKTALVGGAAPAQIPITGKVKGLSVGLDVMPGLGPVAQIPMAALMDHLDDPKFDGLRDTLFPNGIPTGSTYEKVTHAAVPSFLQKILKGNDSGFDDRAYASQVIDSMRYLASTGQYKVSGEGASQAEISRLIEDAKSQTSTMALIRGLAQTTSPTAPAFDWEITDKDGKRVSALVLGRELHELQTSTDPQVRDNAILTFLDKHGTGAFALLQGKSMSISPSGALPPTKEARAWLNDNSFARGEYPLTYGLFAPNGPDDKFDGTTYFETLDSGDREPLDAEVALKLANRKIAQAAYYSVRGQLGSSLSAEQSVALYNFRKQLEQRYPGYSSTGDEVPGAPTKASRAQVLGELEKAAADPRLAKSTVTEPLAAYMELRKVAQDWSTKNLGRAESWTTSKEGQAVRQMMYDTGRQIAVSYPQFASAWETVLLPEFDNALVDQQAGK